MQATEVQNIILNREEWELIGELLRREIRRLPVEIRHTDVRTARQALHDYLVSAEVLLEKLRPVLEG